MNRRGFLAALLSSVTLDPDRLLWQPGAKLISIPAPRKVVIGGRWYPVEAVKKLSPKLRFDQMRAIADPRVTNDEIWKAIGISPLTD